MNYLAKELDELVTVNTNIFKFITDNALDGTWYWDLENPEHEWMNERFWETLGYDPSKMPHKAEAWQNIIHADDLKTATENFIKHCEDENHPYDQVVRYKHKKGHTVWVRCRGIAIRNNKGVPIRMLGAHNDITSEKELEIRLKNKLNLYNQIIKSSDIGTWTFDFVNNSFVLENWSSIIGHEIDPSILKFRDLRKEIIHPDDFEKNKKLFENHIEGKSDHYESEYRIKHHNGEWIWVIDRGQIIEKDDAGLAISMVGLIIDISQRKRNEELIDNYRNLLDEGSEAISLGTWEVDLVKNSIYWNTTTKKIHEVSQDYIPNLDEAINFFPEGETREKITSVFQEAITSGKGYDIELDLLTFKNNVKKVRTIGIPVVKNGKCIKIRGLFQDISQQAKANEEIKSLLEISTEQNNRLTNFAHIVSHNLRSHVGNQKMLLDFLKMDHPEMVKSETFNLLSEAIQNLNNTVEHLTEVVVINDKAKNEKKLCNLNQYIASTIVSISAKLMTINGTVENEVSPEINVFVVPAYLESILLNFLTNAKKYRSPKRPVHITLKCEQSQDYTILSIEDNGLGIDLKKHGAKLFGMYKTFHNHEDARGIGLFITKNQIEAMGGKVTVESEVDKGTTFKIYFRNNEEN